MCIEAFANRIVTERVCPAVANDVISIDRFLFWTKKMKKGEETTDKQKRRAKKLPVCFFSLRSFAPPIIVIGSLSHEGEASLNCNALLDWADSGLLTPEEGQRATCVLIRRDV